MIQDYEPKIVATTAIHGELSPQACKVFQYEIKYITIEII